MNNKTKKTDVEIYNFELAQIINKEKIQKYILLE